MATIKKKRQQVETSITGGLHTKLKRKVKKNGSTMAKVLRDAAKAYVKAQ